jgi:DNA-binding PadR family transcriptional regulator
MPKKTTSSVRSDLKVSEAEGALLGLILRREPTNAYQLYKSYERSPVSSINSSKGQVYPALKRLEARGLVKFSKAGKDGEVTEVTATAAGKEAVLQWIRSLDESLVVIDDPLRTRLLSFELLSHEQRLEWIANAKMLVKKRMDVVRSFKEATDVPFNELAYVNASSILKAKMDWLDELLFHFVKSGQQT